MVRSAIEAILRMGLQQPANEQNGDPPILTMLAEFLDDDHSRLRLAPVSVDTSDLNTPSEVPQDLSLDSLSKAVGL